MSTIFYACFLLCCLFAHGAMKCVNVTNEVQGICPFYNKTVEGYLPEIERNAIIFHFGPLFDARCSTLTKIFFCSSLFPLCLPSGVVLPCRDVCFSVYTSCHHIFLLHGFKWPKFLDWTAIRCLHVHVYVYLHRHQHHCFQFHLPLQYGPHLRLRLLRLLHLLHLLRLFLGIIVLLYWTHCFLLYLDFLLNI